MVVDATFVVATLPTCTSNIKVAGMQRLQPPIGVLRQAEITIT